MRFIGRVIGLVIGLLCLALAGCATGKAVTNVCSACELLHAAGVCPVPNARTTAKPLCPDGSVAYITNFDEVFNHLADPVIECRFVK